MRKLVYIFLALVAMTACKTNENNYREAYERTMARDSARTDFDETIYGRYRREARNTVLTDDSGDTAKVTVMRVYVTADGGGIRESLKKYNVVVAGFKQLLNANSMRQRFQDGGYPGAFVVETPEPYYYVVAQSFIDLAPAKAACAKLRESTPVTLRAPYPYILVPPILH